MPPTPTFTVALKTTRDPALINMLLTPLTPTMTLTVNIHMTRIMTEPPPATLPAILQITLITDRAIATPTATAHVTHRTDKFTNTLMAGVQMTRKEAPPSPTNNTALVKRTGRVALLTTLPAAAQVTRNEAPPPPTNNTAVLQRTGRVALLTTLLAAAQVTRR
jgi:hypothetical protein